MYMSGDFIDGQPLRLPGVEDGDLGELEAVIDLISTHGDVDESLFAPASSLEPMSSLALGPYSLTRTEQQVPDWSERYLAARGEYIERVPEVLDEALHGEQRVDSRNAPLLTMQPVIDGSAIPSDELAQFLQKRVGLGPLWEDDIIVLAGHLPRRERAILLHSLADDGVISPGMRDSIKRGAKRTSNRLNGSDDVPDITDSKRAFDQVVQAALEDDGVHEFAADLYGPKAFLKRESPGRLAMVRRLEAENFAAWMMAYEAEDTWRKLGFEHIPIEPILDFRLEATRRLLVDVRTILLRSMDYTQAVNELDEAALASINHQRRQIKEGLDRLGIRHGHLHGDNLQVVGASDDPRLFVIDFDMALIERPSTNE